MRSGLIHARLTGTLTCKADSKTCQKRREVETLVLQISRGEVGHTNGTGYQTPIDSPYDPH